MYLAESKESAANSFAQPVVQFCLRDSTTPQAGCVSNADRKVEQMRQHRQCQLPNAGHNEVCVSNADESRVTQGNNQTKFCV